MSPFVGFFSCLAVFGFVVFCFFWILGCCFWGFGVFGVWLVWLVCWFTGLFDSVSYFSFCFFNFVGEKDLAVLSSC